MSEEKKTEVVKEGIDAPDETVMVARQPIFDRKSEVYGYELLFRSSFDNRYQCADAKAASRQTMSRALHSLGLDAVVSGKKAFVNFTPELLAEEIYGVLPSDRCVIEVQADIFKDSAMIDACRKLRASGYELAVDVDENSASLEALELADYLKIDFRGLEKPQRKELIERLKTLGPKIIAQKVETRDEFNEAQELGCHFAQGYFFCKPEIMVGKALAGSEVVYMDFMRELNQPKISYECLETIIKRDTSLSLKLLRYLNSAAIGLRNKINSIQRALVLLGESSIRKWGMLVVLTNAGKKHPHELLVTCLIRARFCEKIAISEGMTEYELDMFLVGLLSLADAVFQMPMEYVLQHTAVSDDSRLALMDDPSAPRELVRVLKLVKACERGAWGEVVQATSGLRLTQSEIAVIFYESIAWADQSYSLAA
jgi:c-di-GMP-related signal transduction protein